MLSSRASGEHHHLLPFAYPHALKPDWIGADPAGAANTGASSLGSHISQLRRAGFVVRMRRSDVESGLNLLRAKLFPAAGAARLVIHARCERLIEALENYHYPSALPSTELPEKDGPDHLCDALRYMIVNLEHGAVTTRRYT